jgi:hypothetical protein
MYEEIRLNYFHPGMNIAVQDIRNAWLLNPVPLKLITSIHRGNLVFRVPGSGKRISYRSLKKGLIKKRIILKQPLKLLPF